RDFYVEYGFRGLAMALENRAEAEAAEAAPKTKGKSSKRAGQDDMFEQQESAEASEAAEAAQQRSVDYDVILTWDSFEAWLAKIEAAALTALDTETTSLDELQAQIVGISFSVEPAAAAYIPL